MSKFLQELKNRILVFDGSKGTMFQKMGLSGDEPPEILNLTHPDKVKELYFSYIQAGANVIQTNTFGANRAILEKFGLGDKVDEINSISVKLAKEAAKDNAYVAASIGPTGKLLEPIGDLTFEEAYDIFKEQVISVTNAGADVINFETIADLAEMRAAILAARENSPLPIIASMTFESNGFTLMGTPPAICAMVCQTLGADLIGSNCSVGPENLIEIIKQMRMFSSLPLVVKPNAGLPSSANETITYNVTPESFKKTIATFINYGVRLIGGCCGTTPEFISAIREEIDKLNPKPLAGQPHFGSGTFICSSSKYINLRDIEKSQIGFFINNTNLENFKNLSKNNLDIIINRTMELIDSNYKAIYLNLDIINKSELLPDTVKLIQTYSKLPLILQTVLPLALESALRIYNGKAGVVLDNTEEHLFDLIVSAKKYGSTIVNKSFLF